MHAVVGIPCDLKQLGPHPFHAAGGKYVAAVLGGAQCLPLLLPALGEAMPLDAMLDQVDGILLPGSPSNVEPFHYAGEASRPGTLHDPARDATTLPLIRRALARGIPLLGICRGFQEINVALGGTLYQQVQEQPGMLDHREPDAAPLAEAYAPAHAVQLAADSLLAQALGVREIQVNSLHQQGVHHLAPGLRVEARAPDGLIEAFSLPDAPGWTYAVQWHPEWQYQDHPASLALFTALGAACRQHRARRAGPCARPGFDTRPQGELA